MCVNFDLASDPNVDHVLSQLRYAQAESQLPAQRGFFLVSRQNSHLFGITSFTDCFGLFQIWSTA
jgi:hypothetical protein